MPDLFSDVDLVFEQVEEPPLNGWCSSGHTAPKLFRNQGPGSPEEPTRFFLVKHKDVRGIYCEPCLIVANHMARLKKQGLM